MFEWSKVPPLLPTPPLRLFCCGQMCRVMYDAYRKSCKLQVDEKRTNDLTPVKSGVSNTRLAGRMWPVRCVCEASDNLKRWVNCIFKHPVLFCVGVSFHWYSSSHFKCCVVVVVVGRWSSSYPNVSLHKRRWEDLPPLHPHLQWMIMTTRSPVNSDWQKGSL